MVSLILSAVIVLAAGSRQSTDHPVCLMCWLSTPRTRLDCFSRLQQWCGNLPELRRGRLCVPQALSGCECLSASMRPGVFLWVVSSRCQRRQKMSAVSPENPAASECAPR